MSQKTYVYVTKVGKYRTCIAIVHNGKRKRFYNGKALGLDLQPIKADNKISERNQWNKLAIAYENALSEGWSPFLHGSTPDQALTLLEGLKKGYKIKSSTISVRWLKEMNYSLEKCEHLLHSRNLENIHLKMVDPTLTRQILEGISTTSRSFINHKRALSSLIASSAVELGITNPFPKVKNPKTVAALHKPIQNIQVVLQELYLFDKRLHLCCLLSFGCLLRPHREIRELTWGEISSNLDQISLSGSRNKGKRNRIVPIPTYIKPYLEEFATIDVHAGINVFTGAECPFSPDFFKGLWTKYKRKSKLLEKDQTLYSFRHTGAIQVYEKTGSLTKLQQVMGHSSLQVSLTYLRGLDVPQLHLDDLPCLY